MIGYFNADALKGCSHWLLGHYLYFRPYRSSVFPLNRFHLHALIMACFSENLWKEAHLAVNKQLKIESLLPKQEQGI